MRCKHRNQEERNHVYAGYNEPPGITEYDIYCQDCDKFLVHWYYGYYDLDEYLSNIYYGYSWYKKIIHKCKSMFNKFKSKFGDEILPF